MKIRKARPGDAPVIAEFNIRLARETEHLELDRKIVSAGVRALLKDPKKGVYFVAEEDGQLAGQLCLTYEWSDWRDGNFWWIQSVFVRKECRGRGVFSTLFSHVEARARRNRDIVGLRLYMEKDNHRARRAYAKLGLKQTYYQVFEKLTG